MSEQKNRKQKASYFKYTVRNEYLLRNNSKTSKWN